MNTNVKFNKKYLNMGQIFAQVLCVFYSVMIIANASKLSSLSQASNVDMNSFYGVVNGMRALSKNFSSLNFFNALGVVIVCLSIFMAKESSKVHKLTIAALVSTRLSIIIFAPVIRLLKLFKSLGNVSDLFSLGSALDELGASFYQIDQTRATFGQVVLLVSMVLGIIVIVKEVKKLKYGNDAKILKDEDLANIKKAAKDSGEFAMYTIAKGKEKIGQGLEKAGEKLDDYKEEYEAKKKEEQSSEFSENSKPENNQENTSKIIEEVADKSSDAN